MKETRKTTDIAIVGMACIVPGAPDAPTFWQNIVDGVDAVSDPPPDWGGDPWYDPDSDANDRIYCRRGGYLGELATFDPLKYGIMPNTVDGAEPEHFLALKVAHAALADAGVPDLPLDRERTEVILGRGTFVNRGYTSLHQHGLFLDQMLMLLEQLFPEYDRERLARLKEHLKAQLPPFNAQIAPGLVSTIMTGRVANRLDLKGCNYSVDAACASSLIAVEQGVQHLALGYCDTVIAGGVQLSTDQLILMVFSQLGALSRTGTIRPFAADANGTLLGEGLGMVVLKRLADAERDGNRIYAVLKGVASASDGRGKSVVAPRVEGEALALARAYERAGIDPATVGLVEAHGTAMPLGDATEIQGLGRQFGPRRGPVPTCAIGSVKSMIAHLIPAAGIAGLIKTALALYHRTLPPTLHCDKPNPELGLERTPFYINTRTRPWIHGGRTPRRAGVNAFGFGGINAHAILEEYTPDREEESFVRRWPTELCVFAARSRDTLVTLGEEVLRFLRRGPADLADVAFTLAGDLSANPCRLAIVAASCDELADRLAHALERLRDPARKRIREKKGIYFFEEQLGTRGDIAFLYPGEGSQYVNMLADLCLHFPVVRRCFDSLDRALADLDMEVPPSRVLFPPPSLSGDEEKYLADLLWDMEYAVDAVITADRALTRLLAEFGITPRAMVGHSSGEFMALEASGAIAIGSEEELRGHIRTGHRMIRELARGETMEGWQLVAMGPVRRQAVEELLAADPDRIFLAMDNCPHQAVLCVPAAEVEAIGGRLRASGTICQPLAFGRPYHTPLYAPACGPLDRFFDTLPLQPPKVRLYSCLSTAPMPPDPAEVRRLCVGQWAATVRFRETVQAMYEDNIRIFLEVGPNAHLTGFVNDILKGREAEAMAVNVHHRSGLLQLQHCLGLLAAHGVELDLEPLFRRRALQRLDFRAPAVDPVPAEPSLSLQLPLLSLEDADIASLRPPLPASSATGPAPAPPAAPAGAPSMQAYLDTMEKFLRTQQEVMQAWLSGTAATVPVPATPSPGGDTDAAAPPAGDGIGQPSRPGQPEDTAGREEQAARPVRELLLAVVAERTGYPAEMIDPDLDMEADLGIDSIKRVEILGGFLDRCPVAVDDAVRARLTSCRTLAGILELLEEDAGAEEGGRADGGGDGLAGYPFLREIVEHRPGRFLRARCRLDLEEDRFLLDHTLGRELSVADPQLQGLPIMPLTMSMEMMAEAGAALAPGRSLTGMRDLRAYRWITLEHGSRLLELAAEQGEDGIRVSLREVGDDGRVLPGLPVVEATMVFAPGLPAPPPVADFTLQDRRPSVWRPETLYAEGMFSGPCFRTVAAVPWWGSDGIEAVLKVLPFDHFFTGGRSPAFVTDPVLLDGAGQLIAYWIADHRSTGFNVYPFRMERLEIFGPHLEPGTEVTGRARITALAENQLRSTIELVAPDGRLHMRITGWDDRSFDLPDPFYRVRFRPRQTYLSRDFPGPLAGGVPGGCCRRMDDYPDDLLHGHGGVWNRVLAFLALDRGEREAWLRLPDNPARRRQWLLARIAAKDAVRHWLKQRLGVELCMADVEITADDNGRPLARVQAVAADTPLPLVSMSHSGDTAVAVAAGGVEGIGIDLEEMTRINDDVLRAGFDRNDLERLGGADGEEQRRWALRLWCAREACGKALGLGLPGGPADLALEAVDRAGGRITLRVRGRLAELRPELADTTMVAVTGTVERFVFATAYHPEGESHGRQQNERGDP